LNVDVKGFQTLANSCKTYGHKKDSDFDKWKNNKKNSPEYYMFYTVVDGKTYLYYEKIDEQKTDEQFKQYLPKGTIYFDKKSYDFFFRDINFSAEHWQKGGNVGKRLDDMRLLAGIMGNQLGISLNTDKITYRLFETQKGAVETKMYIPTTTKRNDNIRGFANWSDDITSIELDGYYLEGSISDVVSTTAEEVYHKYQMSEVEKLRQGKEQKETEKARNWMDSFNEDKRENYSGKIVDLQKKIDEEKNSSTLTTLTNQKNKAGHSYHKLAHEKDAKEYAGQIAAVEYFVRKIRKN
jgi:hypothetical protein